MMMYGEHYADSMITQVTMAPACLILTTIHRHAQRGTRGACSRHRRHRVTGIMGSSQSKKHRLCIIIDIGSGLPSVQQRWH